MNMRLQVQKCYKKNKKIICKQSKTAENQSQENILKATRKKVTFKGVIIRLTHDHLIETMEKRRHWNEIFKMLNKNTCEPIISYLQNIAFQSKHKYFQINKKRTGHQLSCTKRIKNVNQK